MLYYVETGHSRPLIVILIDNHIGDSQTKMTPRTGMGMFPNYEAKKLSHTKKKLESIFYDMKFFFGPFPKMGHNGTLDVEHKRHSYYLLPR